MNSFDFFPFNFFFKKCNNFIQSESLEELPFFFLDNFFFFFLLSFEIDLSFYLDFGFSFSFYLNIKAYLFTSGSTSSYLI